MSTPTSTPIRAAFALAARLIRRGTLILALAIAAYLVLKVASYLAAYPDAASRAGLAQFDTPAVRMLQGVPRGVDTPGGFTIWDGGYVAQAITGVWALLVTTRLLRGEEESGRSELVSAAPISAARATAAGLLAIGCGCLLVGGSAAAAMTATRTGAADSVLFGLALAGFTACCAGIGAVAAQIFSDRRRAVQVSASLFAAWYLLRVAACSTDDRAWLSRLTPFGWVDDLHLYAGARWWALTPLLITPILLAALAVALRARRDAGAGLVTADEHAGANLHGLGSPLGLAWRSSRGVLLGWLLGLGSYAFLIGALLQSMVDYLDNDPNYRRILAQLGMDLSHPDGFVGVMASLLGVGFALYGCWRLGAARAEEDAARVENLLVRPITRSRWLGGQILLTVLGGVALAIGCGLAIWAGARLTGAQVGLLAAVQAMLNTLPAAAVAAGLAVALFGLAPRLTVTGSAGATVAGYVVQMVGPALHWPGWVVDLAPFHHLALVPAQAFALTPALALLAVAAVLTVVGVLAFERRDLVGA